jgi:glyoxylase-like metal-dependent hydrolase (beta-lactamase superfamily II)
VEALADGILRINMPLPFPPGQVNIWLLRDGDGWAAIDAGYGQRDTIERWETILHHDLVQGRPITKLIVTHAHSDHAGAAGWLAERFGLTPYVTRTEWLQWRLTASEAPGDVRRYQLSHLARAGCPDFLLDDLRARPLHPPGMFPLPLGYHRVHEGQSLTIGQVTWSLSTGEGHSPEQLMMTDHHRGIYILADQVLPRITPFVGVMARDPESDPLNGFLRTLERMREIPADALALPSHGDPFRGASERVDTILAHHAREFDKLRDFCRIPRTAYEAAELMFRVVDRRNFMMAVTEALAHLRYLARAGILKEQTAPDGPTRFVGSM